jgi:hypothetical protein
MLNPTPPMLVSHGLLNYFATFRYRTSVMRSIGASAGANFIAIANANTRLTSTLLSVWCMLYPSLIKWSNCEGFVFPSSIRSVAMPESIAYLAHGT